MNSISAEHAEEIALKIDTALQFADLGAVADPFIKPIILYYSCVQLCGVYTRAFFNWEKDPRGHGLTCTNTTTEISENGQFPRLATTTFLLTGQPNCFAELVTFSKKPIQYASPGELLAEFGKSESRSPLGKLTLDELTGFDYVNHLKSVRKYWGFHKAKILPSTAFLVDVWALFVSSSLARYNVIAWRKILEGKGNAHRLYFEETFERFLTYTIDLILLMLEKPTTPFDHRLIPSKPSPYSHDDHYRFKVDPDSVS